MKKASYIAGFGLLTVLCLAPQVTFAAWWNPFTWGVFVRPQIQQPFERVAQTQASSTATAAAKVATSPAPAEKGSVVKTVQSKIPETQTVRVAQDPNPTLIGRDLTLGDNGPEVALLQKFLVSKGYVAYGYSEGQFDSTTQRAVSSYQARIGISATGFVGSITRAAVNAQMSLDKNPVQVQPVVPTTVSTPVQLNQQVNIEYTNNINRTTNINQTNITQVNMVSVNAPTPAPKPPVAVSNPLSIEFGINGRSQDSIVIGKTSPWNNPIESIYLYYQATSASSCARVGPGAGWEMAKAPDYARITYDSLSLPVGVNTFTVTCSDASGASVAKSVTVTVNPLPTISCPQSTSFNGITFSVEPCELNIEMAHGKGNRAVRATLTATGTPLYGFTAYGYGVGFPTYGLMVNPSSGGAQGNITFDISAQDSVLMPDGSSPRVYSGYLPIGVNDTHGNDGHLYIKVNVTVTP